jgi:hypothetical protein
MNAAIRSTSTITILALLFLSALVSMAFGFISPDSWNYLYLAQSLRSGDGCSVDGQYFANFPCGYPLAIALTTPSADISSLMIGSKFTNLVLLFSAFLLVSRVYRNALVPTFIAVNPITIAIFQHTWSENLFLVAFCGAAFAIARISRHESPSRYVALLGVFLVVGCASRYFFGPFAVVLFLCAWVTYGKKVALRTLPAFVAAGVFFVAYQGYNLVVTGHSTGMPRIPAPESAEFLLMSFLLALARDALYLALSAVILLVLSAKSWTRSVMDMPSDENGRNYMFLALAGVGFLVLAFALRTRTQYDLYSYRTIGYGVVFVAAGLMGLSTRLNDNRFPILAAAVCCAFSIIAGQGRQVPRFLKDAVTNGYTPPTQALSEYRSTNTDADVIVALATPRIAPAIASRPSLYYPEGARIVRVLTAPNAIPQTRADLVSQLRSLPFRSCVIDFTPFDTIEEFRAHVSQSFPVDVTLTSSPVRPETISRPRYDPSLQRYLLSAFKARSYVACPL